MIYLLSIISCIILIKNKKKEFFILLSALICLEISDILKMFNLFSMSVYVGLLNNILYILFFLMHSLKGAKKDA